MSNEANRLRFENDQLRNVLKGVMQVVSKQVMEQKDGEVVLRKGSPYPANLEAGATANDRFLMSRVNGLSAFWEGHKNDASSSPALTEQPVKTGTEVNPVDNVDNGELV